MNKNLSPNDRHNKWIVAALFLLTFCAFLVPILIPPLAPEISKSMNTDVMVIGVLSGIQFFVAGISSFLAGALTDRFGRKQSVVPLLFLSSIALALMSLSTSVFWFYFWGITSAMLYGPLVTCALASIGDYFPEKSRAKVTGVTTSGIFLSSIIGVPIGLAIAHSDVYNWRNAFWLCSILFLITAVFTAIALPTKKISSDSKHSLSKTLRLFPAFFLNSHIVQLFILIILTRAGTGMYMTYGPSYLLTIRNLPEESLMLSYLLAGGLAFITSIVAGRVINSSNKIYILILSIILISLATAGVVYLPDTYISITSIVIIANLIYAASESFRMTIIQTSAVSFASIQHRGAFLGLFSLIMSLAYALGSFIGGGIIDIYSTQDSSGLMVGYPISICLTLSLWALSAMFAWNCLSSGPIARDVNDTHNAVSD